MKVRDESTVVVLGAWSTNKPGPIVSPPPFRTVAGAIPGTSFGLEQAKEGGPFALVYQGPDPRSVPARPSTRRWLYVERLWSLPSHFRIGTMRALLRDPDFQVLAVKDVKMRGEPRLRVDFRYSKELALQDKGPSIFEGWLTLSPRHSWAVCEGDHTMRRAGETGRYTWRVDLDEGPDRMPIVRRIVAGRVGPTFENRDVLDFRSWEYREVSTRELEKEGYGPIEGP